MILTLPVLPMIDLPSGGSIHEVQCIHTDTDQKTGKARTNTDGKCVEYILNTILMNILYLSLSLSLCLSYFLTLTCIVVHETSCQEMAPSLNTMTPQALLLPKVVTGRCFFQWAFATAREYPSCIWKKRMEKKLSKKERNHARNQKSGSIGKKIC